MHCVNALKINASKALLKTLGNDLDKILHS